MEEEGDNDEGDTDKDDGEGMDTGVGSSFTMLPLGGGGRIEPEASAEAVRGALESNPSSSSSFSQRLTTSSRLITTELPDAPCARSARSLHGRPANRLGVGGGGALLGPATTEALAAALGCLKAGMPASAAETDMEAGAAWSCARTFSISMMRLCSVWTSLR